MRRTPVRPGSGVSPLLDSPIRTSRRTGSLRFRSDSPPPKLTPTLARMAPPVTVAVARFEDLVAIGLNRLITADDYLSLVAEGVRTDELERMIADRAPAVAVLNFGSLSSAAQVFQLHQSFPGTRLVVLANRPTAAECNQMLSFGATACLSKETQGRDVVNAIHLASRGMHVLPSVGCRRGHQRAGGEGIRAPHPPRGGRARAAPRGARRTPRSPTRSRSASRPCGRTPATSTASSASPRGASSRGSSRLSRYWRRTPPPDADVS